MTKTIFKRIFVLGFTIAIGATLIYQYRNAQRPALISIPKQPRWEGVWYERIVRTEPRLNVFHIVTIDLSAEGVDLAVTPPNTTGGMELTAIKTSAFLEQTGAQVGVNGGYFYPFHASLPLYYYPHTGDPVNVVGESIANGVTYSEAEYEWPVICFGDEIEITRQGCPEGTEDGLTGNAIILEEGRYLQPTQVIPDHPYPHARVVVAFDKSQKTAWIVVVDGRQSNYSYGLSIPEMADFLLDLGAFNAINLDGGGSTTLALQDEDGAKIYNAPFHTHIPMVERPVANHLIVYANPLPNVE